MKKWLLIFCLLATTATPFAQAIKVNHAQVSNVVHLDLKAEDVFKDDTLGLLTNPMLRPQIEKMVKDMSTLTVKYDLMAFENNGNLYFGLRGREATSKLELQVNVKNSSKFIFNCQMMIPKGKKEIWFFDSTLRKYNLAEPVQLTDTTFGDKLSYVAKTKNGMIVQSDKVFQLNDLATRLPETKSIAVYGSNPLEPIVIKDFEATTSDIAASIKITFQKPPTVSVNKKQSVLDLIVQYLSRKERE